MSGIPGGITYLMLFLQKFDKIDKMNEKKISMYLNIWLRAPLCIIFSTLLYIKNIQAYNITNDLYNYYLTLNMIIFTSINGIHFMHTITESHYTMTKSHYTHNLNNKLETENEIMQELKNKILINKIKD